LTSELPCRPSKQEHSFYLKRQLVFPVSGQEAEDEEDPLTVTVKTDSEIEVANIKDRVGKMVVPLAFGDIGPVVLEIVRRILSGLMKGSKKLDFDLMKAVRLHP
jgi:hypothetical protein